MKLILPWHKNPQICKVNTEVLTINIITLTYIKRFGFYVLLSQYTNLSFSVREVRSKVKNTNSFNAKTVFSNKIKIWLT